jgi:hypothetical protein
MIQDWDGTTFKLLTNPQIENLPLDDRERYIARLHTHMLDNGGRDSSPWYHEWKRYDARCRHEDCTGTRYDSHLFCVRHLDIDTIDPDGAVNRRAVRAKLKMAELLETAVDELEKIVTASPDEVAPMVRLKAVSEVFDRANLPRQTAASVSVDADIKVTSVDTAAMIAARLDRLASSIVSSELAGIEAASEIHEAEVIEDGI